MAMVTVLTAAIPKLFFIFKMTQWYRQATDFPPWFFGFTKLRICLSLFRMGVMFVLGVPR